MSNKDIPGFYWELDEYTDSEKKKYFQIQANHVAPAGSLYSQEAVKKRKRDEEHRQRRTAMDRRLEKERVQRAISLKHPLIGLNAEIGGHPGPGFKSSSQRGRVFANQMQRRGVCSFGKYALDASVIDFARDVSSGVLLVGANVGRECRILLCPPILDDNPRWSYDPTRIGSHLNRPLRLSSVSLHRSGHYLATMDSGLNGGSHVEVCHLPDERFINSTPWLPHQLPRLEHFKSFDTFWSSAANPYSDEPSFAIATSAGLVTLSGGSGKWDMTRRLAAAPQRIGRQRIGHSVIDAVEWLSVDVIASGFRDSSIWLTDVRSNGDVKRLQHPHSVFQIRKVDEHRLVVAGCKSLQMYDLRFPLNGLQTQARPLRQEGHTSTKPYLVFEDYESDIHHRIALSTELGVLATATPQKQIQLYSIADGSIMPSPASQYEHPFGISRLSFEDIAYPVEHDQGPRLMVSHGHTIQEWTW